MLWSETRFSVSIREISSSIELAPSSTSRPGVLVAGGVHLDEALGEHLPGTRQIPAREPELELVLPQVALDLAELLVREVVRVDRPLEVRVEPLDLSKDALRLRLLRRDRWSGTRGRGGH